MKTRSGNCARSLAGLLTLAFVCVWLAGGCAALAQSIHAAKHSCCEKQQVADGCSTLCAASHRDVTPAMQGAVALPPAAPAWIVDAEVIPATSTVLDQVPHTAHPPPLYLQHAALLI